tara:strand:+ start:456 stop:731 length:276 start_codon:yes stop_codon:yes gene_type:complete
VGHFRVCRGFSRAYIRYRSPDDHWPSVDLVKHHQKGYKMTKQESKHLDFVLMMIVVASTRGADKTDMLNAFAFDMDLIRKGKKPTESKKLI